MLSGEGAAGTRGKPALAVYWASSCGGCEVSILNIAERLLDLGADYRLVFCPCLADAKHEDVRALPDGAIDLCLLNGNIRSAENEAMACLLRRKSRCLVAFGSCAHEGCVPGLANLTTAAGTLDAVFRGGPTTDNPRDILPGELSQLPEGVVELPRLFDTVRTLDQVVPVDYYVPGCPPESPRVVEVLELFRDAFRGERELPPAGAVLGAGSAAVCEECPRSKPSQRVERFLRPHEVAADAVTCLLDQGLICLGPATRRGCGALCPRVNMGCEGCYGPPDGVRDVGARMVATIAALSGPGGAAAESVVDPAGTFYRFSLAHSILRRARVRRPGGGEGAPA